jgi:HAD superfamily hydrolase (TIGR01509 family)
MAPRRDHATLRAVLWDNDGVLVDTEPLYFAATGAALARVGVKLSMDLYAEISLRQGRSVFDIARARGTDEDTITALRAERDAAYARLLAESDFLVPGVEQTLRSLHGKVRQAVVTSARRHEFEIAHRRTGLLSFFEFVLTREDYENTKPDPDAYRTALARIGLRPEECVVVEDTERGLLAATAAGIRCIVIPNAFGPPEDFSPCHKMVRTLAEAGAEIVRLLDGGG